MFKSLYCTGKAVFNTISTTSAGLARDSLPCSSNLGASYIISMGLWIDQFEINMEFESWQELCRQISSRMSYFWPGRVFVWCQLGPN